MDYVTLQLGIKSSRSEKQEKYTQTIYILPLYGSEMEDAEMVHNLYLQLKAEVIKNGKRNIKMCSLEDTSLTYIRNCAEYVFRDTEIKIHICPNEKRKIERRKSEADGATKSRQQETEKRKSEAGPTKQKQGKRDNRQEKEKVIIKPPAGKSYADLLKSVRHSVNIEEGIKINSIKKTYRGDLMIEILGGKENAVVLKESIQRNIEDVDVIVKRKETILHITDIDASIDEEELRTEISKSEQIPLADFKIITMRPTRSGNQTGIINKGGIKIGWVKCRARRRANLQRCFRCHHYGHRKEDCTGTDRSELCVKLHQAGPPSTNMQKHTCVFGL